MTIRPYRTEDKERLVELLRLNTPTYFHPSEEPGYAQYLDHEIENYYVVEDDGVIIGAGGINHLKDDGEVTISWDIIHPDAQGKGFGRALTQFRLQEIKWKYPDLPVRVRTTQHTVGFYEKMGFVLEFVTKDYWAPGMDLYQMYYRKA